MKSSKKKANRAIVSLAALAEVYGVSLIVEKRTKDVIVTLRSMGYTPEDLKGMAWFARLDQVLIRVDADIAPPPLKQRYGYYAIGNGATKKAALTDLAAQLSEKFVYVNWEEEKLPKLKA